MNKIPSERKFDRADLKQLGMPVNRNNKESTEHEVAKVQKSLLHQIQAIKPDHDQRKLAIEVN